MSEIHEDDVRHVAALARLGLSEARVTELTKDLGGILGHMEILRRVPTDGVAEFGRDGGVAMQLRPDHVAPARLPSPLDLAPDARDGFFLVPRLSTHDDATGDGAS